MIRRLRDSHRRFATLLAVLLPLGYAALLSHRGSVRPAADRIAADLGGRVPVGGAFQVLAQPRIDGRLLAAPGQGQPDALLITPSVDPAIPDLLAYWSPAAGDGQVLPPDAMLIGALRGSREQVLPLPEPGMMQGGYLILYSLVRGEILAAVRLTVST